MSNELFFYLGAAIIALSLAAGILTAVLLRLRGVHLRRQLEQEYGTEPKERPCRRA